jgi:putative NADPH-quinone reductase
MKTFPYTQSVEKPGDILIIVADTHSKRNSQLSVVRQTCQEFGQSCIAKGARVDIIDLYRDYKARKFDPVLDTAFTGNKIREYQIKIKAAKTIIFFYPAIWSTMPALMKGFLDVVFRPGFAFDVSAKPLTRSDGYLTGKKATVFVFEDKSWMHSTVLNNNFDQIFWQRSIFAQSGLRGTIKYFYETNQMNTEKSAELKTEMHRAAQSIRMTPAEV